MQNYSQPITFGISQLRAEAVAAVGIRAGQLPRDADDLTLDLGLRYDRQTLTDATKNFAPRVRLRLASQRRLAPRDPRRLRHVLHADSVERGRRLPDGRARRFTTYTATPGQSGFPTCLTGPCLPSSFDPKTLPPSQLPARNITIQRGQRDFYRQQFAQYGLNFDLLPNYPDSFVNPRSQVVSIGAEREVTKACSPAPTTCISTGPNLDRTVDLNAPSVFDRTAPGQTRTVAAANATRPILPVNGGVRQVNVIMNLGVADYDGLQTQFSYRGNPQMSSRR